MEVCKAIFITQSANSLGPLSAHQRNFSGGPIVWRFFGGPIVAHFQKFTGYCVRNVRNNVSILE